MTHQITPEKVIAGTILLGLSAATLAGTIFLGRAGWRKVIELGKQQQHGASAIVGVATVIAGLSLLKGSLGCCCLGTGYCLGMD